MHARFFTPQQQQTMALTIFQLMFICKSLLKAANDYICFDQGNESYILACLKNTQEYFNQIQMACNDTIVPLGNSCAVDGYDFTTFKVDDSECWLFYKGPDHFINNDSSCIVRALHDDAPHDNSWVLVIAGVVAALMFCIGACGYKVYRQRRNEAELEESRQLASPVL
jgi:hypothetical protein